MKSDQKQINFNQAIELQGKSQLKLVMPALGTYQKIVPGNWLLFHINADMRKYKNRKNPDILAQKIFFWC